VKRSANLTRTKAHKHTRTLYTRQALALFCIYRSRVCVCVSAAAHSRSLTVYIYIPPSIHTVWVFRVKWCLSSFFFREAHTTGTLSRIICASCPAQYLIWQQNTLLAWGQYTRVYISTNHFGLLWVQVLLYIIHVVSTFTIFHIFYSSITFCRRHFILQSVPRDAQTRVCLLFFSYELFFGWPRFFSLSVCLSFSVSRSYTFIIISLLSRQSITWYAGTLSMHCLHHQGYDSWTVLLLHSYQYLWFLSAALYSFHVPAIGAVVLLYIILECVLVACLDYACRAIIFWFEANLVWFTFQQISLYFW
jgi:hypothetical protein